MEGKIIFNYKKNYAIEDEYNMDNNRYFAGIELTENSFYGNNKNNHNIFGKNYSNVNLSPFFHEDDYMNYKEIINQYNINSNNNSNKISNQWNHNNYNYMNNEFKKFNNKYGKIDDKNDNYLKINRLSKKNIHQFKQSNYQEENDKKSKYIIDNWRKDNIKKHDRTIIIKIFFNSHNTNKRFIFKINRDDIIAYIIMKLKDEIDINIKDYNYDFYSNNKNLNPFATFEEQGLKNNSEIIVVQKQKITETTPKKSNNLKSQKEIDIKNKEEFIIGKLSLNSDKGKKHIPSRKKKRILELDMDHPPIPQTTSDTLYNSIVRIEKGNTIATGFFMKLLIKKNLKYFLITCNHVINKKDVNFKSAMEIYYGKIKKEKKKIIILDTTERFIDNFDAPLDITVIEILKSDEIPEDKYLMADLGYTYGYDKYMNNMQNKYALAGYPNDYGHEKEGHISSGKIKEIDNIEFGHNIETGPGSSGSPICLIESSSVIGVHKEADFEECLNYGTFIGVIIDELEKIYKEIDSNGFNKNMKAKSNKYFITLDEYINGDYFSFHIKIINYYNNQNEKNYNISKNEFENYLSENKDKISILKHFRSEVLEHFKKIDENYGMIIEDYIGVSQLPTLFKEGLSSGNSALLEKLSYFIAGFVKALDKAGKGINKNCQLFSRFNSLPLNELNIFKENIGNIISFKNFFLTHISRENKKESMKPGNFNFYEVMFVVNYEYDSELEYDCFDISEFFFFSKASFILFRIFSFFKIVDIKIDEENKSADIILKSIGRIKKFEKKIIKYKNRSKIQYNSKKERLEIK